SNNLDDMFARRKCSRHLLANRFGLHLVDELLDDLKIDVRLKQRQPQLAQGLLNVLVVEDCLTAQRLECPLKPFLKVLKHSGRDNFISEVAAVGQLSNAVVGNPVIRRPEWPLCLMFSPISTTVICSTMRAFSSFPPSKART